MNCNFVPLFVPLRSGKTYRRCACGLVWYGDEQNIGSNCRLDPNYVASVAVPTVKPLTFDELPCVYRGEVVGTISDCGCGSGGPAPVAECSKFCYCVPTALGARAKWRDVPGVIDRPVSCAVCALRVAATT